VAEAEWRRQRASGSMPRQRGGGGVRAERSAPMPRQRGGGFFPDLNSTGGSRSRSSAGGFSSSSSDDDEPSGPRAQRGSLRSKSSLAGRRGGGSGQAKGRERARCKSSLAGSTAAASGAAAARRRRRRPPKANMESVVALDYGNVEREVLQLKEELSVLHAEAMRKQELFTLMQERLKNQATDKGGLNCGGAHDEANHAQKKLWAIEEALKAETYVKGLLGKVMSRYLDQQRQGRAEMDRMHRGTRQLDLQVERKRAAAAKMLNQRAKAEREVCGLEEDLEQLREMQERQMRKLVSNQAVSSELEKRTIARAQRRTDVSLEMAGDLDEDGEKKLRQQASLTIMSKLAARGSKKATKEYMQKLEDVMRRLKGVTGAEDVQDIVQRFLIQRTNSTELAEKQKLLIDKSEALDDEFEAKKAEKRLHQLTAGAESNAHRITELSVLVEDSDGRMGKGRERMLGLQLGLSIAKETAWRALKKMEPVVAPSGGLGAERKTAKSQQDVDLQFILQELDSGFTTLLRMFERTVPEEHRHLTEQQASELFSGRGHSSAIVSPIAQIRVQRNESDEEGESAYDKEAEAEALLARVSERGMTKARLGNSSGVNSRVSSRRTARVSDYSARR